MTITVIPKRLCFFTVYTFFKGKVNGSTIRNDYGYHNKSEWKFFFRKRRSFFLFGNCKQKLDKSDKMR